MESEELKLCPYCAEEIKHQAFKCKHCGEWLDKPNNLAMDKKVNRDGFKINIENNLVSTFKTSWLLILICSFGWIIASIIISNFTIEIRSKFYLSLIEKLILFSITRGICGVIAGLSTSILLKRVLPVLTAKDITKIIAGWVFAWAIIPTLVIDLLFSPILKDIDSNNVFIYMFFAMMFIFSEGGGSYCGAFFMAKTIQQKLPKLDTKRVLIGWTVAFIGSALLGILLTVKLESNTSVIMFYSICWGLGSVIGMTITIAQIKLVRESSIVIKKVISKPLPDIVIKKEVLENIHPKKVINLKEERSTEKPDEVIMKTQNDPISEAENKTMLNTDLGKVHESVIVRPSETVNPEQLMPLIATKNERKPQKELSTKTYIIIGFIVLFLSLSIFYSSKIITKIKISKYGEDEKAAIEAFFSGYNGAFKDILLSKQILKEECKKKNLSYPCWAPDIFEHLPESQKPINISFAQMSGESIRQEAYSIRLKYGNDDPLETILKIAQVEEHNDELTIKELLANKSLQERSGIFLNYLSDNDFNEDSFKLETKKWINKYN
jgi:hypothetical protein